MPPMTADVATTAPPRVKFILDMLERRFRLDTIKRAFCDHFRTDPPAFQRAHKLALEQMVENVSQDRDIHRSQALLTLEAIIRGKAPDIVKVRAQQVINRLLGLDDTNAANNNKVMPVIEVIVRNHGEALEYQDMKRMLELQQQSIQIDARRLPSVALDDVTTTQTQPQDSINISKPAPARAESLIEW